MRLPAFTTYGVDMEFTALFVLAGVALGATAFGIVCKLMGVRIRRAPAARARHVSADELGLSASADFGETATLVQFSTQFCSRCPGTARLLRNETHGLDGVEHIEIDLTDQIEIARRFNILKTPTTLVLDENRHLRARIIGAPTASAVRDELEKIGALPFTVEHVSDKKAAS